MYINKEKERKKNAARADARQNRSVLVRYTRMRPRQTNAIVIPCLHTYTDNKRVGMCAVEHVLFPFQNE